jgi:transposase InsO family protein
MYPSFDMILHREKLLKDVVNKERKVTEVAKILDVERETVSRWLAKYKFDGLDGICPKRPGPRKGSVAVNRIDTETEDLVCAYARKNPYKGPQMLADTILYEEGLEIDQSTIYRILKRKNVRYGLLYRKLKKKKQMYCLMQPGDEVQLDVHFPFGYARKDLIFDAIDDCSRFVFGRVKIGHDQDTAISFVDELVRVVPYTIKAIRTDCGREFGRRFVEHLAELGIEHRRNEPYTPQHNGKIERYHRTFKEHEGYSWFFNAPTEELNYKLKLWLFEYNFKKKHRGLGMNGLTPAQKILYASFLKPMQPHLENVTGTLQLNKK